MFICFSTASQAIHHTTAKNPSTLMISEILGISIGGFVLTFIIIAGIYIYKRQQGNTNVKTASPVINPYVTTKTDPNKSSMARAPARNMKQLPPNYQTFRSASKA